MIPLPPPDEREEQALEDAKGAVMVPLITAEDTPTGWTFTGPSAWLNDWIRRMKKWAK